MIIDDTYRDPSEDQLTDRIREVIPLQDIESIEVQHCRSQYMCCLGYFRTATSPDTLVVKLHNIELPVIAVDAPNRASVNTFISEAMIRVNAAKLSPSYVPINWINYRNVLFKVGMHRELHQDKVTIEIPSMPGKFGTISPDQLLASQYLQQKVKDAVKQVEEIEKKRLFEGPVQPGMDGFKYEVKQIDKQGLSKDVHSNASLSAPHAAVLQVSRVDSELASSQLLHNHNNHQQQEPHYQQELLSSSLFAQPHPSQQQGCQMQADPKNIHVPQSIECPSPSCASVHNIGLTASAGVDVSKEQTGQDYEEAYDEGYYDEEYYEDGDEEYYEDDGEYYEEAHESNDHRQDVHHNGNVADAANHLGTLPTVAVPAVALISHTPDDAKQLAVVECVADASYSVSSSSASVAAAHVHVSAENVGNVSNLQKTATGAALVIAAEEEEEEGPGKS